MGAKIMQHIFFPSRAATDGRALRAPWKQCQNKHPEIGNFTPTNVLHNFVAFWTR